MKRDRERMPWYLSNKAKHLDIALDYSEKNFEKIIQMTVFFYSKIKSKFKKIFK